MRLRPDIRPGRSAGGGNGVMRRRLIFGAVFAALLVLALLGFVLRPVKEW
jgi:hypothetical protein